jgi:hypothetical protein
VYVVAFSEPSVTPAFARLHSNRDFGITGGLERDINGIPAEIGRRRNGVARRDGCKQVVTTPEVRSGMRTSDGSGTSLRGSTSSR